MQMYWFLFLVALVKAQNESSILDKLSYAVEESPASDVVFKPFHEVEETKTTQTNNVSTIIRLQTYDYNATKLSQSEIRDSVIDKLLAADPDDNDIIPDDEVTEPLNLNEPTEVNTEQVPLDQLSRKNLRVTPETRIPEIEVNRDDSTTMIIDLDPPQTTPVPKIKEFETPPTLELKQDVTVTPTVIPEEHGIEIGSSTMVIDTDTPNSTSALGTEETTNSTVISIPFDDVGTTLDNAFTPVLTTMAPDTAPTILTEPQLPTTTANYIPHSTPFVETETIDIPPPNVNVAAPIITLPDEPEVVDVSPPVVQIPPNRVETVTRRVTIPIPVGQAPPYGSNFFIQSGDRVQAYPFPSTENEKMSLIFNVMSRYRMPQLVINHRPYVFKVPQARIVEV